MHMHIFPVLCLYPTAAEGSPVLGEVDALARWLGANVPHEDAAPSRCAHTFTLPHSLHALASPCHTVMRLLSYFCGMQHTEAGDVACHLSGCMDWRFGWGLTGMTADGDVACASLMRWLAPEAASPCSTCHIPAVPCQSKLSDVPEP